MRVLVTGASGLLGHKIVDARARHVRDWLYVTDNGAAIDLVTQRGAAGEIYNIASGEEQANVEVAKGILKLLKKPEGLIKWVTDRPGHDRRYSLSIAKIRTLGWEPKAVFSEGLKRAVNWYVGNPWWWQPLMRDNFFKANSPWLR